MTFALVCKIGTVSGLPETDQGLSNHHDDRNLLFHENSG
jgi:hypothetical protein